MHKMRLGFHRIYTEGLHPDVRFPRHRYLEVEKEIKNRGGESLIDFHSPRPATPQEMCLAHCKNYIERFLDNQLSKKERREIGLRPWTEAIVTRTKILTGGTISAAEFAVKTNGYAANMAGGTHHAYYERGSGYCIVNDIAIAAHHLRDKYSIQRIAIIDLDVHQGDGTAAIFQHDDWVYTLSVHGQKNFPFRKQKSSLDIGLPNETQDQPYLQAVARGIRSAMAFNPECVFFQGGVDPLIEDKLGKLNVSREGLIERNKMVFDAVDALQIPCIVLMGGGYANPIGPTVTALCDLFMGAAERHHKRQMRTT